MKNCNIQYGIIGVGGINKTGLLLNLPLEKTSFISTIIKRRKTQTLVADNTKMNQSTGICQRTIGYYQIMDAFSKPVIDLCEKSDIEIFEVKPQQEADQC